VVKPQGACKGEVCIPLGAGIHNADGTLSAEVLAHRLGMPLVEDSAHDLWALGPETSATGHALTTAMAPDLELPTFDGGTFRLSSLRGTRVVVVAWASWCGCAHDLPVWQELREQVRPKGIEIVTVALDTGGLEAARAFVERAKPQHPALIDVSHVLDELFGVVNVPNCLWIDEDGMIVRPPEPGFPGRSPIFDELREANLEGQGRQANESMPLMNSVRKGDIDQLPPGLREMLDLTMQIRTEPELYRDMILDWAEKGRDSQFVLSPDEVVKRSHPRSLDEASAAAHFELGQHLHRGGDHLSAVTHFREAHRLQPDNWTYKRQAWRFEADAADGDPKRYDSNWSKDVRKIGPENYYPKIDA
jgi:peroxiredoxin